MVTVDREIVPIEIKSFTAKPEMVPEEVAAEKENPEERARITLAKAGREAEQIVRNARSEAAAIIESAKEQAAEEAESIRAQARDEAYQEGYQKAETEGAAIMAQANQVLVNAERERDKMEAQMEPDMVRLVIDIVTKLLGDMVRLHPEAVVNLIRQGLSSATITGDVAVRVSPHDFEAVAEHKEVLLAMTDSSVKLDVVRDPSLQAADCVIETPFGNIDCGLNQQFESLRDNLTYILTA